MSNFFAALDDSGDEAPKPAVSQKNDKKAAKDEAPIVEASKPERRGRQRHDDRNTKTGRGRPFVRDGKRQYDRRSGTGRGREIKKGGGGGRNWGSDRNEMRRYDQTENSSSNNNNEADDEKENEDKVNGDDENEGAGGENRQKEEEEEEEEEDKTMTYDEYVRQKSEKEESELLAPIVPTKEVENEFEGMKMSAVKEEASFTEGKGKQYRKKGSNSNKKTSNMITPSFRVGDKPGYGGRGNDRRDGRGGRGGGGRGRGNRRDYNYVGRGGRGGRKDDKPVDFSVTDEAFPSL